MFGGGAESAMVDHQVKFSAIEAVLRDRNSLSKHSHKNKMQHRQNTQKQWFLTFSLPRPPQVLVLCFKLPWL